MHIGFYYLISKQMGLKEALMFAYGDVSIYAYGDIPYAYGDYRHHEMHQEMTSPDGTE